MSEVRILFKKLSSKAYVPTKAHPNDAGFDIRSAQHAGILPNETRHISTHLSVAIPDGWELQVRSRSGLASKGIVVANSPGTIDAGYRGEIGILLHNTSDNIASIYPGDRIAQLVVGKVYDAEFVEVDELGDTQRGSGGFGSSGQ